MGDPPHDGSGQADQMTHPQIPVDWHPETYAVDEPNKVVWKKGSHAFAMSLNGGKAKTLIPGYTIQLCTEEELVGIRDRIKAKTSKPASNAVLEDLQDIAFNCLAAIVIGGPLGLFLFGTGPSVSCDIPGLPDSAHQLCWEQAKARDKWFATRTGVLMVAIAAGLTWRDIKKKNHQQKTLSDLDD